MIQLDYRDRRPLYRQIMDRTRELVLRGVLKTHDRLPSVRELARELTVNPNTIQRAYKELEEEGFIYSVQGRGFFAAPIKNAIESGELKKRIKELENTVLQIILLGVDKGEVITLINRIFKEREGGLENDTGKNPEQEL